MNSKLSVRTWSYIFPLIIVFSMISFGVEKPDAVVFEDDEIIDGITMVAPPKEFPSDPMLDVKKVGADWISCVPYGYFSMGESNIRYNIGRQWWGEKKEGIEKTIAYAHDHDLKVMLKPQIWSHTGWIGDQDFETDEEWKAWEKSYTDYIMFYIDIAIEKDVEMVCIGTELKMHVSKRPAFFTELIAKIRMVYNGKLIYSANWDSYDAVKFWGDLDYIGLSAYFPLSADETPKVKDLIKKWQPTCALLNKTSRKYGKKIIFTEYGYLSIGGSAGKTWLLEKRVRTSQVNEKAQANSYEALYKVFSEEPYWAGGFLWKWFPFGQGGEGYNAKDYTPQGKLAEKILTEWYSKW